MFGACGVPARAHDHAVASPGHVPACARLLVSGCVRAVACPWLRATPGCVQMAACRWLCAHGDRGPAGRPRGYPPMHRTAPYRDLHPRCRGSSLTGREPGPVRSHQLASEPDATAASTKRRALRRGRHPTVRALDPSAVLPTGARLARDEPRRADRPPRPIWRLELILALHDPSPAKGRDTVRRAVAPSHRSALQPSCVPTCSRIPASPCVPHDPTWPAPASLWRQCSRDAGLTLDGILL